MKHTKKLIAAGLVLVMAAGLSACAGGGSAEDIMKTAQAEMAKVKSMTYEMGTEMQMSAAGQTIDMTMSGTIDYFSDPLMMKMDMTTDAGAQGKSTMSMYAEQDGNNYIMYMSQDGTNWAKQTVTDAAALEQYNAKASMDMYLESIESFKEAGTEKINGSDATKYEGVISKDAMNDVMAASGAADQLTSLGLTKDQAEAMYKDLGELPVAIWIDKESSLPVKYEMDMTGIMDKMMANMAEAMGAQAQQADLKVEKMVVSMTITGFDNAETFTIPEAAKNAPETSL